MPTDLMIQTIRKSFRGTVKKNQVPAGSRGKQHSSRALAFPDRSPVLRSIRRSWKIRSRATPAERIPIPPFSIHLEVRRPVPAIRKVFSRSMERSIRAAVPSRNPGTLSFLRCYPPFSAGHHWPAECQYRNHQQGGPIKPHCVHFPRPCLRCTRGWSVAFRGFQKS